MTVQWSVTLSDELAEAVRGKAKVADRSVASYIRLALVDKVGWGPIEKTEDRAREQNQETRRVGQSLERQADGSVVDMRSRTAKNLDLLHHVKRVGNGIVECEVCHKRVAGRLEAFKVEICPGEGTE